MSALALGPPLVQERLWPANGGVVPAEDGGRAADEERRDAPGRPDASELGGEPSLDALVSGIWEGLAARQAVQCPLCGGRVRPVYGAHPRPVGGRCEDCETVVS